MLHGCALVSDHPIVTLRAGRAADRGRSLAGADAKPASGGGVPDEGPRRAGGERWESGLGVPRDFELFVILHGRGKSASPGNGHLSRGGLE